MPPRPEVPLVVSEVNPEALDGHKGLIANPNCSTMQLMVALKPIHDAAGIDRLIVSTYQSVSGHRREGRRGARGPDARGAGRRAAARRRTVYPHPIAFNVLGGAGNFADGDDHTDEERKMMFETRKILGDEDIRIAVTCARVPVRSSHSESVTSRRATTSRRRGARAAGRMPGLCSSTTRRRTATRRRSTPPAATRSSSAACAATRRTRAGLQLWVVSDNLLKGAATNAVQIAEVLHERNLVRVPTKV